MDEQDRTADLDAQNMSGNPPTGQDVEGEGVPVPSQIRRAVEDVKRRASDERDVVEEYEARYYGGGRRSRLESPAEEVGAPMPARISKAKRHLELTTDDPNERKWAALAHASTLLTALVALASGGMGVLLTMFVPLCIYFSFRKRSEYVAFHALQAFTIQLVGTVGWLALFLTGTIVWVGLLIVSALLILVLIGIVLLPVMVILYPIFVVASLALPLGMVIYSMIATFETWSGHDYRYPYIARWVDSQTQHPVV